MSEPNDISTWFDSRMSPGQRERITKSLATLGLVKGDFKRRTVRLTPKGHARVRKLHDETFEEADFADFKEFLDSAERLLDKTGAGFESKMRDMTLLVLFRANRYFHATGRQEVVRRMSK